MSQDITLHNFTIVYSGIETVIKTDARVCYPHFNNQPIAPPGQQNIHAEYPTRAIWDTGATNTVITKAAARALGLTPINRIITHGVHGPGEAYVYMVGIILPNNVRFDMVQVTECDLLSGPNDPQPCDILIGMDIIANADFAISNAGGQTTFSFCMPSVRRIDFTQPIQQNPEPPKPIVKVQDKLHPVQGRNELCKCGSGKKYKYCHGK